jgi:AAA-like domain
LANRNQTWIEFPILGDSDHVLSNLLKAAASGTDATLSEPTKSAAIQAATVVVAATAETQAPRPVADPRVLRQPGGAVRQMGKTSLLIRYLAKCKEAGKHTALVDFQVFTSSELEDLQTTLSMLAPMLLRDLGIDPSVSQARYC